MAKIITTTEQKRRQIVILAALAFFLLAASFLSGLIAKSNAGNYFSKDAVRESWVSVNSICYLGIAVAVFLANLPGLLACKRGATEYMKLRKSFPKYTVIGMVLSGIIIIAGAVVCSVFHIVSSKDLIYLEHVLWLSPVFIAMLIEYLCLFFIGPIADLIGY